MKKVAIFQAVIIVVLTAISISAEDYTADQANVFFINQDYNNAAAAYDNLLKSDSTSGMFWFRLAYSAHQIEDYPTAINAYHKANNFNFAQHIARYNLACVYSMTGQKDLAFDWLASALDAGFTNVELIKTDTELEPLRSDDRFPRLVEYAEHIARPCEYDERYSQLDFWLGEWEVFNQNGNLAGENTVTKSLWGCVIRENWVSAGSDFTGQSVNFFDPEKGKWQQIWNDNAGQVIRYDGVFENGMMRFNGYTINTMGERELSRMTLKPLGDGKVEQHIENSKDDGKTWYNYFLGTYVPKENTPPQAPTQLGVDSK